MVVALPVTGAMISVCHLPASERLVSVKAVPVWYGSTGLVKATSFYDRFERLRSKSC
jgi:hypothetical protein